MANWHYLTKDGQRGPVDAGRLRQLYVSNVIGLDTSIWSEGMKSWEPLSFHRHLVRTPPNSINKNSQDRSVDAGASQSRAETKPEPERKDTYSRETTPSPVAKDNRLSLARGWILALTVLAIVGMLLYPPFQIVFKGSIRNMGYGSLFSPPSLGNFSASIAVQILSIQILVVFIVGSAAWYLSGYIPHSAENEHKGSADSRILKHIKNAGWFLIAGMIALVIFGALIVGLSAAISHFSSQGMLEASLIFDSYLKLNALVLFSAWAWLAGRFLSKDEPRRWGLIGLCIYLVAPIIPYLFSFFVTASV